MKHFLNAIRKPVRIPIFQQAITSFLLFVLGVLLGVISKVLDETASNLLPSFLEGLDLRNFFSRMGVWMFLAVCISLYSKSPLRSVINVFLFFGGMVSSYYVYTIAIAGFFPKTYMMIWIGLTVLSPLLAFVCWYAKGEGTIAIAISSIILLFMSRQVFVFGFWYFDLLHPLEFLLWVGTIFILYQSPKQIMKVLVMGMIFFFLTARMNLLFGLL